MLESYIVNGHPWSISCADPDPAKCGVDDKLMSDIPENIQKKVSEWIFGKLWKIDSPNYKHTSYTLKHLLERQTKIYVTNNQMKDALLLEGFYPVKENELNWVYCVSQNSPAFTCEVKVNI
ncbi:MAG TPA: hypothetical protein PLN48_13585 [Lachnospiraceae bacterium]|nr:hypothetical protein [Lachnospiraceae bacterium]